MIRVVFALLIAAGSIGLIAAATVTARPSAQLMIPSGVWELQAIVDGDGNETVPVNPANYTIEFIPGDGANTAPGGVEGMFGAPEGTVSVQLDCNSGSGEYTLDGVQLSISNVTSTLMACPEPTLANQYAEALDTANFFTVEEGSFILFFAGGSLHFVPAGSSAPAAEEAPVEEAPVVEEAPAPEATPAPTGEDIPVVNDASASGEDGQVSDGVPAADIPASE